MSNNVKKEALCDTIVELLCKYNRRMYEYGKAYRNYGTSKELRVDQIQLINHIGDHPGLNLRTLAALADISVPTLSLQIDRLKKFQLITKQRSEVNQREVIIDLTPEGRVAYDYHKALDRDFFDRTTQNLMPCTEAQLETIVQFMQRIELAEPTL